MLVCFRISRALQRFGCRFSVRQPTRRCQVACVCLCVSVRNAGGVTLHQSVCSGIIGGGIAIGNLAGAFLGMLYPTIGKAWSYVCVYVLLILATLVTGTLVVRPSRGVFACL
jgi:hypothetical protein